MWEFVSYLGERGVLWETVCISAVTIVNLVLAHGKNIPVVSLALSH